MKGLNSFARVSLINQIAGNHNQTDWVGLEKQAKINLSEANEGIKASDEKNLEEYVDAMADNLVTAYGGLFRIGVNADLIMEEVTDSLLTRFDRTIEDAVKTQEKYSAIGVETTVRTTVIDGVTYFPVVSAKDQTDAAGEKYPTGKFLKSYQYRKPSLMPLIPQAVKDRLMEVEHVQV